jgi:hypothetical protein
MVNSLLSRKAKALCWGAGVNADRTEVNYLEYLLEYIKHLKY